MQLQSIKAIVAAAWISAVCAGALAGHVGSLSGWTLAVGIALLPPLAMLWLWNAPRPTMSEAIQKALK